MRGKKVDHAGEHLAADVVEVNIHSVRAGGANLRGQVFGAMVDTGGVAQFAHGVIALFRRSRDSNCTRPHDAGSLARRATHGSRRSRYQNGLTWPWLTEVDEPRVAGQSG